MYDPTLGLRVIKKKKEGPELAETVIESKTGQSPSRIPMPLESGEGTP